VLELLHLDDFRVALDALHEGVRDRPPHRAREGHELVDGELLVAKENDAVLEECAANGVDRRVLRQIDPVDLGADGAGDADDLYCSTLMFCALMICP
jgi:hypothetical protein